MQRFKNILVYADGDVRSTAVLERAVELASRNHARLTVLSVLESLPWELQQLSAAMAPADLWELAVTERRQKLDRLVERSPEESAGIATKVVGGSPFIEIIKEVLRQQHDLVMMVAEGDGGVRDALFGSTSTRLMRKCPCPVWVVKSGRSREVARILAAVNPSPPGQNHDSLSLKIMELAASLARLEGSRLHLLHAWAPVSQWLSMAGSRLSKSKLAHIDRSDEASHLNWFDELLGKVPLNDLKVQRHMLKGEASELIVRLAKTRRIDVIVMGTICRTGVPGLLIGNTAEKVLRHVNCSVLTVKPDGFVTPVTL